jgi:Ca2+-binding EF-hand superfamily protein
LFDIDGDGYISLKDMQAALSNFEISSDKIDSEMLVAYLDTSKNGYVEFKEFS